VTDTRTTSTAMKVAPAGANPPSVNPTASAWTYGSWVEIIAATSAPTAIAGIFLGASTFSSMPMEWQIGVGPAASEVAIHTWRTFGPSSAGIAAPIYLFPVPVGAIAAGTRVSLRVRTAGGSGTFSAGLLYYTSFDSVHYADDAEVIAGTQIGSALVTVTPSSSAWADSAWVELTSGIGNEISLLGLTATASAVADVEFDLGTGSASAEVVRTTVRSPVLAGGSGLLRTLWLPAPMPLPANTRVAARMRKSGTSTTAHGASLVYLDPTGLL